MYHLPYRPRELHYTRILSHFPWHRGNELLVEPLSARGIILRPARIGKPGHKGCNVQYRRLLIDIKGRLLSDASCYCTTMLDYYGLPSDFPGKSEIKTTMNSQMKSQVITKALTNKIRADLGDAERRFLPYIQMHEFEGLLFSEPNTLASSLQQLHLISDFVKIREQAGNPEEINDSPQTAPSKRIEKLYNAYDKPVHPLLAARAIGLHTIRINCPVFDRWLTSIESLVS